MITTSKVSATKASVESLIEETVPKSIRQEDPLKWAPHDVDARRKLLADICDRIRTMGVPAHHTWSGVDNDVLLPNDVERLGKEIGALKPGGRFCGSVGAPHPTLPCPTPSPATQISMPAWCVPREA